jgi:hypothetical protein
VSAVHNRRIEASILLLGLCHPIYLFVLARRDSEILTEEQLRWVRTSSERVHKLISETPPDGPQFDTAVKHILGRERQWNAWKNDGCPKFDRAEMAKEAMRLRQRDSQEAKKTNNTLRKYGS